MFTLIKYCFGHLEIKRSYEMQVIISARVIKWRFENDICMSRTFEFFVNLMKPSLRLD